MARTIAQTRKSTPITTAAPMTMTKAMGVPCSLGDGVGPLPSEVLDAIGGVSPGGTPPPGSSPVVSAGRGSVGRSSAGCVTATVCP